MPRKAPEERLDELVGAALRVFAAKGFRGAQMADVAAEMGVSQGTLYNYVESKEGLFSLCLDRLLLDGDQPTELPVRALEKDVLADRLRRRLAELWAFRALGTATERADDPRAELEAVLGELYDAFGTRRLALDAIERSAREVPEFAEVFYVVLRRDLIARLAGYIETRVVSGQFRAVEDPPTVARLLIETITYFARHRFGDLDSKMIDDGVARRTVIDILSAALLAQ